MQPNFAPGVTKLPPNSAEPDTPKAQDVRTVASYRVHSRNCPSPIPARHWQPPDLEPGPSASSWPRSGPSRTLTSVFLGLSQLGKAPASSQLCGRPLGLLSFPFPPQASNTQPAASQEADFCPALGPPDEPLPRQVLAFLTKG